MQEQAAFTLRWWDIMSEKKWPAHALNAMGVEPSPVTLLKGAGQL